MAKKTRFREYNDTHRCVWCGEHFEVKSSAAKTCSPKCRTRLSVFRRECGWEPDEPPGPVTAQFAIDVVIMTLLNREKKAREAAARHALYLASLTTAQKVARGHVGLS